MVIVKSNRKTRVLRINPPNVTSHSVKPVCKMQNFCCSSTGTWTSSDSSVSLSTIDLHGSSTSSVQIFSLSLPPALHLSIDHPLAGATFLCVGIPRPVKVDPLLFCAANTSMRGARPARALQGCLGNGVRNGCENLGNVVSGLGRGLEEEETFLLSVCLGLLSRDLASVARILHIIITISRYLGRAGRIAGQIQLVTHKRNNDTGGRLSLKLGNPVLGLDERSGFRKVVNNKGGLGVAVVHGRQRGEALLACCIPNLELDRPRRKVALLG